MTVLALLLCALFLGWSLTVLPALVADVWRDTADDDGPTGWDCRCAECWR